MRPDRFDISPPEHWWAAGILLACLLLAVYGWADERDRKFEAQQRAHEAAVKAAKLDRMRCTLYSANRIRPKSVLIESCVRVVKK